MHLLDQIVAYKRQEIEKAKNLKSASALKRTDLFQRSVSSMRKSILSNIHGGIIAEFKRKSPSKQDINLNAIPSLVAHGYTEAGVAGISVLTDTHFFGGNNSDLLEVRANTSLPVLRKEFIIDTYQLIEAKSIGADCILLIARILKKEELRSLTHQAHDLGMEVLIEVHNQEELDKCPDNMDLIGINNRDLDTFKVDYDNSKKLQSQLPKDLCQIAESGLSDIKVMKNLHDSGFNGFLIGEAFMRDSAPGEKCITFLTDYYDQFKC